MDTPITTHETPTELVALALSPQAVIKQAALIQQVMQAVMRDGEHYGCIPGTGPKKTLLKSGAEKLCFTFGLSNRLTITTENLPNQHREYTVTCDLYDRQNNLRGQGVGLASTMESKYRYRGTSNKTCPKCAAMAIRSSKKEYGGGYYCDGKSGGCGWSTKAGTPEAKALDLIPTTRQENPDPADQYNTVLKMAKKRALVDAVLTATAASDIFSQDLEDLEDRIIDDVPAATPAAPEQARTVQTEQVAPAQKAAEKPSKTKKAAPAGQAPAAHDMSAANALWSRLQTISAGYGNDVLKRLAALHGAATPKELAPDRIPQFLRDVADIDTLGDETELINQQLADWEHIHEENTDGTTTEAGAPA